VIPRWWWVDDESEGEAWRGVPGSGFGVGAAADLPDEATGGESGEGLGDHDALALFGAFALEAFLGEGVEDFGGAVLAAGGEVGEDAVAEGSGAWSAAGFGAAAAFAWGGCGGCGETGVGLSADVTRESGAEGVEVAAGGVESGLGVAVPLLGEDEVLGGLHERGALGAAGFGGFGGAGGTTGGTLGHGENVLCKMTNAHDTMPSKHPDQHIRTGDIERGIRIASVRAWGCLGGRRAL
jgi:hypothetical protein